MVGARKTVLVLQEWSHMGRRGRLPFIASEVCVLPPHLIMLSLRRSEFCSTWVMSDLELELWDTMIRSTIVVARSASVYPTQVVEHIINRVTNDPPAQ
jgi:hypothetical protein